MFDFGLPRDAWKIFKSLKSPGGVQRYLDERIAYDLEPDGPRCRSPLATLRAGIAHCMGGALFGVAVLRVLGHAPLLLDLEASRDDDHVLALFRAADGCWGAEAKSNYSGLRFREPIYRTLRELVISYFEHYYNEKGEKTLRTYSRPVNLARFDSRRWISSEEDVWYVPEYLITIPHTPILTNGQDRRLSRMDKRLFEAGQHGMARH